MSQPFIVIWEALLSEIKSKDALLYEQAREIQELKTELNRCNGVKANLMNALFSILIEVRSIKTEVPGYSFSATDIFDDETFRALMGEK